MKDLIEAIILEAKQKARDIVEKAKEEGKGYVDEVNKKWDEKEKELVDKIAKEAEEIEIEKESWANLEAKRIIERSKEKLFNKFLSDLSERVVEYKKTKAYKDWLNRNIRKAMKDIGARTVVIKLPKGDKTLLDSDLLNAKNIEVIDDLDTIAGFIVQSKIGDEIIDATFEEILNSHMFEIKRLFFDELDLK